MPSTKDTATILEQRLSRELGATIVDQGCAVLSPELEGSEGVFFRCQKAKDHRGTHRVTLQWGEQAEMFGEPPWKGLAE